MRGRDDGPVFIVRERLWSTETSGEGVKDSGITETPAFKKDIAGCTDNKLRAPLSIG